MKASAPHLQLEFPLAGGAVATPTGLRLPPGISLGDYEKVIDVVFRMEDMAAMCKSDAVRLGRERFGDAPVSKILRTRGVGQSEVKELLRLEAVEVRVADLTVEHHFAVSALDREDQARWLEAARVHELSAGDLRASVRAGVVCRAQLKEHGENGGRISATSSPESLGVSFARWRNEVTASLGMWSVERWREARDQFEPMARFHAMCCLRVEAFEKQGGAK